MSASQPDLIFGIGNSGRTDDGLGWAFLDLIKPNPAIQSQLEYRYQLQIEDAALIRDTENVLFVDAYQGKLAGGCSLNPCEATSGFDYTSHVLAPQAVLQICHELYGKMPRAHLLLVQGSSWELRNGLTSQARTHLDIAIRMFWEKFTSPEEAATEKMGSE